jgi:hypothetical protein
MALPCSAQLVVAGIALASASTGALALERAPAATANDLDFTGRRLEFVASLMSGHVVLQSGLRADGSVYRHILSKECPLRGESEVHRLARIRAVSDATRANWLAYFTKLADLDGSDRVSAKEAKAFKDAIYYGMTAAQLADVKTFEKFEELMDDDDGVVAAALERYPGLREAAERDGMTGLPELPDQFRRPNPAP